MKLKGRAGAYSFYSSKGRQVARVAQNATNYGESARRSLKQMLRRVRWSNLVNAWKDLGPYLQGSFETKKANETDYNAFMSKNIINARVALTKEQAAVGFYVMDAFKVSEGSLQSITNTYVGDDLVSRIKLANAISEATTIAELTADILANNSFITEGMQITYLAVMTIPASSSGARSYVTAKELTLDREDTRLISDVYDDVVLQRNANGLLATANQSGEASAAFILSDSTTGKLRVSTETLVNGDEDTIEGFCDDEQVMAAIETYGLDATTFLESGDLRRRPGTPQQRILYLVLNGVRVDNGSTITLPADDQLQSLSLIFSRNIEEETELTLEDLQSVVNLDNSGFTIASNIVSLNETGIAAWREQADAETSIPSAGSYDTEAGTVQFSIEVIRS